MPTVAAARAAIVAQIVDGSPNSITPTKLRTLLTDLCDALDAETPVNKVDATSAPTADDDSADTSGNGVFSVGSLWIDVSADEAYRCVDATATAAVWVNTTVDTTDVTSIALSKATYDPANIAEQVVGLTATQTLTGKTLTSPVINTPNLGADSVDAITEIAAALRTGSDTKLVTGTAGGDGELAAFNADGDAVGSGYGVLDEDTLASDSDTDVPTQQSVKAYVDAAANSPWTEKTSTYTAVSGNRLIADTVTTSAFTINLPATPSTGANVTILAGSDFDTNNLTIGRNGSTIMDAAADLTVDTNIRRLELVYDGSTWRVG